VSFRKIGKSAMSTLQRTSEVGEPSPYFVQSLQSK
jgi:hypothetical protein